MSYFSNIFLSLAAIWTQFGKIILTGTEDSSSFYKTIRWLNLISAYYPLSEHFFDIVYGPEESKTEVEKLLTQYNLWIEANKKTASRYAQMEALDTILQSIDFSNSPAITEKVRFSDYLFHTNLI